MDMRFVIGAIAALLYGVFCLLIGLFKWPPAIWNMGKIQAFRNILKDLGTQIFISVWGAAAIGLGIWLFTMA